MRVKIVQGDITRIKADVIVNAANRELQPGGGVCGAIYRAAGQPLYEWSFDQTPILVGESVTSPSYGMKNCHAIIHTVGPLYNPASTFNRMLLAEAYHSALSLADKRGYKSIAFPAISTGIYGFPRREATEVVRDVLEETNFAGDIILVCFSDEDYKLYKKSIKPIRLAITRTYNALR